jgi:hypothetical protein
MTAFDPCSELGHDGPRPPGYLRAQRLGGPARADEAALRTHARAADRAADQARARGDAQGLVAARLAGLRVLDRLRGQSRA